jgi:predicted nucleic acid-binding protein
MREDARASAWLAGLGEDDRLFVSVVTNAEIRYGILRMPPGRRRQGLEQAYELLLPQLDGVWEVSEEVSGTCAEIKATLEGQGIILPENDLWIAATALVHQATLVTNDHHFATVPGLAVEDWSTTP